jgi:uncharacterized protein
MSDKTIQLPKTAIPLPMDEIAAFCQRWNIIRLEVFGSILRDDFDPARSDVDVIVTIAPELNYGLLAIETMRCELVDLLGRDVDLIERPVIEQDMNLTWKHSILSNARVVYE